MKTATVINCVAGAAAIGSLILAGWTLEQQRRKRSTPSESTTSSPSPSRLLALPTELRNQIWEEVLTNPLELCIYYPAHLGHKFHNNTSRYHLPPLLRVCKQTRIESFRMFYAANIFTTYLDNRSAAQGMREMYLWLQHLQPEARASLRTIEVLVMHSGFLSDDWVPRGGEFLAMSTWSQQSGDGDVKADVFRFKVVRPRDRCGLEQRLNDWVQRVLRAGHLARQEDVRLECTLRHMARIVEKREVTKADVRWAWVFMVVEKAVSIARPLKRILLLVWRHTPRYWFLGAVSCGFGLAMAATVMEVLTRE